MSTPFRSKKGNNANNRASNKGTELAVMHHSIPSEIFSSIRPPTVANAFIAASRASAVVNDGRLAAGKAAAEEARRRAAVAAAEEARRAVAAEEAPLRLYTEVPIDSAEAAIPAYCIEA